MPAVAADYLKKLDIKIVKLMADRNDNIVDIAYLRKCVEAYPDVSGFVEGYWPPAEQGYVMVKEKYPSIRLAVHEPRGNGGVYRVVDSIESMIEATSNRPLFLPVIYNIYSDSYRKRNQTLFDKLDSIRTILDDKHRTIVYVRLDVMMELIKEYNETNSK